MLINHDYSYINNRDQKLVDAGYGKIVPDYVWFDRYFTEEQREENRELAESLSKEEWDKRCVEYEAALFSTLEHIKEVFNGKFDIHQISEETNTIEHYKGDWDLYFWSNRGWNGSQQMTRFSLSFNDRRSPESRVNTLNEVIAILEGIDCDDVAARIQYGVHMNDVAIEAAAAEIYKDIEGKFINYYGATGKIKIISECEGLRMYGFFKKGAKSKYQKVLPKDILLMNV